MKILVLTRSSWDDTNSTGNTMSNFWAGWDPDNIANIYCRSSAPNNNVCKLYYSLSEKDLFLSIFNRKFSAGNVFSWDNLSQNTIAVDRVFINEDRLYGFFRKNSFTIALWLRELLWGVGRWKNNKLRKFLNDFKPDAIFATSFSATYPHSVIWYLKEVTNAKVILFHADDCLTVKGLGGSPLARLKREISARTVKESAKKADLNYCISPRQQQEYTVKLGKEMRLLYKGDDFKDNPPLKEVAEKIRIVYIGSILYGRWKTIGILARAIKNINIKKSVYELVIYSQYKPSKKEMKAMVIDGASCFLGKVPSEQIPQIFSDADIVLHVESFENRERNETRLSFSTKIVDCLHSGRCLLAIGWEEAASIDYLKKNDAALVATNENEIIGLLTNIANNPSIISEYSQKAWNCGKKNHQLDDIRKNLYKDIHDVVVGSNK